MTRKELIKLIRSYSKYYIEDVANGVRYKELADAILALPIDVPGDEEIEIKYSTSLPVLCCLHDIPIKFDAEQGGFLSHMRDNNDLKQRGAKWMRSEIIKRNRP